MLKSMGDNTARDLANAQKEELTAEISFQQLQAAKLGEIASATKQFDDKTLQLSDLLYKVSKAKEDVEDTSALLASDQAFLAETVKGCDNEDAEYAKRVKVRAEEVVAIAETLDILTGRLNAHCPPCRLRRLRLLMAGCSCAPPGRTRVSAARASSGSPCRRDGHGVRQTEGDAHACR